MIAPYLANQHKSLFKHNLLISWILLLGFQFCSISVFSQQYLTSCHSEGLGDTCTDAISYNGGFSELNENLEPAINGPLPFLGCPSNVIDNPKWLSFIAKTTNLTLAITPDNCQNGEGIQAGIYENCENLDPPIAVSCSCNPSPDSIIFDLNNLTIDQEYFLVIDGCAGDVCDIFIKIKEGSIIDSTFTPPSDIIGTDHICSAGQTDNIFSIPNQTGATGYAWQVPPDAIIYSSSTNGDSIVLDWGNGAGEVCVAAVYDTDTSACKCLPISFGSSFQEIEYDSVVCMGDTATLTVVVNGGVTFSQWNIDGAIYCQSCLSIEVPLEATTSFRFTMNDVNFCSALEIFDIEVTEDCVWPGDTDTNRLVNHFDLLNIGLAFGANGPPRNEANLNWRGQVANDWSQSTISGTNYKHIDCDGNGIINADDTLALSTNYNLARFGSQVEEHHIRERPVMLASSRMTVPLFVQPDTFQQGTMAKVDVILGDMMNPVDSIYGIGFTILYDTSVVQSGSLNMAFDNSWLGMFQQNLLATYQDDPGREAIDVAMTRTDALNQSGSGLLAELNFIIQDDILFHNPDGSTSRSNQLEFDFEIIDVHAITYLENIVPITPQTTTSLVVKELITSINNQQQQKINIYPNPTNGQLNVSCQEHVPKQIQLYNSLGQIILTEQLQTCNHTFNLNHLPSGIYWIKVWLDEGWITEKLIIH